MINESSQDVETAQRHRYDVEGDSLTGRLIGTVAIRGRSGHRTIHGEEASPVFFELGGIYPNPFSAPTAIVRVLSQANFRIELVVGDIAVVDAFDFVDVESGTYLFPLPDMPPPRDMMSAVLFVGGIEVDRVAVPYR